MHLCSSNIKYTNNSKIFHSLRFFQYWLAMRINSYKGKNTISLGTYYDRLYCVQIIRLHIFRNLVSKLYLQNLVSNCFPWRQNNKGLTLKIGTVFKFHSFNIIKWIYQNQQKWKMYTLILKNYITQYKNLR
jgi:hypothetical protein